MIDSSGLKTQRNLTYGLFALAFLQITIGIIDGMNRYSPVPLGDSWDSMIGFLNNENYKNVANWFSQHNEHRIALTKVIFWLNYVFFDADNLPLIILNYILAGLSFLLFYSIARKSFLATSDTMENYAKNYILFVIFIAIFSKMQDENFDWEFQSQFFLAYLMPLFSLYLLGRSSVEADKSVKLFGFSCFFGILSAGTMANGALTLPALAFLGLLLRISWKRVLILVILSLLVLFVYFIDYQTPTDHSSFDSLNKPLELFLYMISYYGLIFKFLLGKVGCRIFGVLFLILLALNLVKIVKKEEESWINIVLIGFICYVALTGFVSAIGRCGAFGTSQAYSGRYSTPMIMAWVSFLIIYRESVIDFLSRSNKNKYFAFILPLTLVIYQADKLNNQKSPESTFERNVSAISLELGVNDRHRISKNKNGGALHHNPEAVISQANVALENNISIFGDLLIRDVNKKIGKKIDGKFCKKQLISTINFKKIDKNNRFYQIFGEIDAKDTKNKSFYVADNEKITGYVILNSDKTKFKGYNIGVKNIYLYDINNKCRFK